MAINKRGVSILLAMCLVVCAYAQDSLRVSGAGNDTLTLQHSTVTAKSREQKLREGAFAVGALNIRLQASTLQSLTQAIDKTAGIRIREEGGVIKAKFYSDFRRHLENRFRSGDVNHDGVVNVTDVMLVVDEILKKENEQFCSYHADINSDGIINITDAMIIVDILLFRE